MAIYSNKNKAYVGQFLNSDWTELPANAEYKASVEAAAAPPVVTGYPTANASKAGQTFFYKGDLWVYMSKAQLDSLGWTSLVPVGFPAPFSRNPSVAVFFNYEVKIRGAYSFPNTTSFEISAGPDQTIVDTLGLGFPTETRQVHLNEQGSGTTTEIKNAELLTGLEDVGTAGALRIKNNQFTAESIDALFTALPATNKTVTIVISNNPGTATCDPSIATAKGYTVTV
jgi:hypothetical protein